MSAICGLHQRANAGDELAAMLAALSDYGETAAQWRDGTVGLGCRHATTTPTNRTRDADGTTGIAFRGGIAVAADARLDDRNGLCDALGVPRAERRALADSDLIRRAWQRWGRDCPNHLLGDYAFAVWDANKRALFCARDHAGVRPLYYCSLAEGFVFASAVEAILAAPGVSSALDEAAVAAYLTGTGWNSATRTFYRDVRKLPPGHTLSIEGDQRRIYIERYWHPEQTPAARPASDDEYAEEFLALLRAAVGPRLRGGPVGAHLSGGLDSSSIAVLAARELRRQGRPPPPAFSWLPALGEVPPTAEHAAEYRLIDAVCRQEDLRVFHQALSVGDILAILRRDGALPGVQVQMNEEAVQHGAAAQGVRVLLSGWGGDEGVSFNGRGFHQQLLLGGRWLRLAAECRATSRPFRTLADAALSVAHPGFRARLIRWRRGVAPRRRRWLVDPNFARRAKALPAESFLPIGVRHTQLALLRSGHLCQRIERLGRERRAPRHRVSLPALGSPAPGVRAEPPAGAVPPRPMDPVADAPCPLRCPAGGSPLENQQSRPGPARTVAGRLQRGAARALADPR